MYNPKASYPWELFKERLRSPNQLARILPLVPLRSEAIFRELQNPGNQAERCIYIHIPFCTRACGFCGYYKCVNSSEQQINDYCELLIGQIQWLSEQKWSRAYPFKAVYFGGGTPTAIPSSQMKKILQHLMSSFQFTDDYEITLESTFEEMDEEYFGMLADSPVNRVSLGVQSFNEELRSRYQRSAGLKKIERTIHFIREAGIRNICADLMYNLQDQSEESWMEDLKKIGKLGLQGCSVYPLMPMPEAPIVKNKQYRPPSPKQEFDFFVTADNYLNSLENWTCITPVQYGHVKEGKAVYVRSQAEQSDVLAFGPGAGGRINGNSYFNSYTIDTMAAGKDFIHPMMRAFKIEEEKLGIDRIANFFRLYSLEQSSFEKDFKGTEMGSFLKRHALVQEFEEKIQLSQSGSFWAINLIAMMWMQGSK